MIYRVFNLGGINLKVSPLLHKDGELLRCVNVDNFPYGAKTKRCGYVTTLGTANGSAITNLFSWTKEDGTSLFLYRNSGNLLQYSVKGTGAWTNCGNGTVTASTYVPHAVLEDTLFISQEGGTTRHSTNGTAFTDTTAAPAGGYMCASRDNRIYVAGTGSTLFYSTEGDGTNWSTSGTADSSSLKIPGEGGLNAVWFANDKVMTAKDSGLVYAYDGYSLFRLPTTQGPSSYQSLDQLEDYWMYLNRQGFQGFGGARPELMSNAIENQIYNDPGNGIVGTIFDNAPGVTHKLNYFCAVGTVTDEITGEAVNNCIEKYNYQANEWSNYTYNNFPNSFCSYKDASGVQQLIFGSGNQCYKVSGTATSDNGQPIESIMEGVITLGVPDQDKNWSRLWAIASPGCGARVAIAISNSFNKASKKWVDIGDLNTGVREFKFPSGSRSKFLYWKLNEYSTDARFTFYGFALEGEPIG